MMTGDTARVGRMGRMRRALQASGMGFLMRLLLQLVQVPLYLSFWGVEYFGEWLLLFAAVGFLSLLDFGACSTGANAMAQQVSKGASVHARQIFTVVITVVAASLTVFSLLGLSLWAVAGDALMARFTAIPAESISLALVCLVLAVWIQLATSALGTVLRAVGKYAEQTTLGTISAFTELCAIALALFLGGGAGLVAAFILVSRLLTALIAVRMSLRSGGTLLRLDFEGFAATLRSLTLPSLSYLLFPATNVLNLQGVATIVGLLLGPAALAGLATLRTLARLVDIVPDMFAGIVTSEAAYAEGRSDSGAIRTMSAVATLITLCIALISAFFLFVFGSLVYEAWTRGEMAFDAGLLVLLMTARLLRAAAVANTAILVGMNVHAWLGTVAFLIHVAALMLLAVLLQIGLGFRVVPLTLLAIEGAMCATVFHELSRRSGLSFVQSVSSVFSPTTSARALELLFLIGRRGGV